MQQGQGQPVYIANSQKIVNSPYPHGINAVQQFNRAQVPINPREIAAQPLINTQISWPKTSAFVVVFALLIFGSVSNLSGCQGEPCQPYLGYLIAICICGLVYLLMSLAIHFKRPDSIHVDCLSLFLFGNPELGCCDGCSGVLIAIFIIFVAPIAFLVFLVAAIKHCKQDCKKEERRRNNSQIQMSYVCE